MSKWLIGLCIGLLLACNLHAKEISDLLSDEQLRVKVGFAAGDNDESSDYIVGQPITVTVEVITADWFSKGSRIEFFELDDVVIPPVSELAINGSEAINGKTWVSQLREITFYPTKAKAYTFPALNIFVSVKTAAGVVEGVVESSPFTFDVLLPKALKGKSNFVVSTDFDLTVESDFEEGKGYVVGDAITETYTFTADNLPAMMLPIVELDDIEGVSIYRKPSQLSDANSRGEHKGRRIEVFTYIFESSGIYTLPQQIFYWWDLNDSSLREVLLPSREWNVGGQKGGRVSGLSEMLLGVSGKIYSILFILVACFALVLMFFKRAYWISFTALISHYLGLKRRRCKQRFCLAIDGGDYRSAYQLLYEYYGLPFGDFNALDSLVVVKAKNIKVSLGALKLLSQFAFDNKGEKSIEGSRQEIVDLLSFKARPKINSKYLIINEKPLF